MTNDAMDALIGCQEEMDTIQTTLRSQHPELMERLQELRDLRPSLVESAKGSLREMGAGSHEVGGHKFSVASGGIRKKVDIEAVLVEAEERGHMPLLLEYGFIDYVGNPDQLSRLPDEIQVVYQDHVISTEGSLRVGIPKRFR